MIESEGSDPREAAAAEFNKQQASEAVKTEAEILKNVQGLRETIGEDNPGVEITGKGLEEDMERETTVNPETARALEGLIAEGNGLDHPSVQFVMETGKIPENERAPLFESIKAGIEAKGTKA